MSAGAADGWRADFGAAAQWLVELTGEVRDDQWDQPALGTWDVRALTGHAGRALGTVEEYLAKPAQPVQTDSPIDYLNAIHRADPAGIAARGVAAGEALGPDPLAAVTALAERVVALVAATPDDAPVATALGGMTLRTYLPTRTLELIVHGLDLAAAIGSTSTPPAGPTDATARLAVEAVISAGGAAALCEVVTGRPVRHGRATVF